MRIAESYRQTKRYLQERRNPIEADPSISVHLGKSKGGYFSYFAQPIDSTTSYARGWDRLIAEVQDDKQGVQGLLYQNNVLIWGLGLDRDHKRLLIAGGIDEKPLAFLRIAYLPDDSYRTVWIETRDDHDPAALDRVVQYLGRSITDYDDLHLHLRALNVEKQDIYNGTFSDYLHKTSS